MTENTTPSTDPRDQLVAQLLADGPLVPAGRDPLDDLTVAELGIIGRQLGRDPYAAVQDKENSGLKWEALGRCAWLWAKRRDPRAKLDPILQLSAVHIAQLLDLLPDDEPAVDDDQPTVELADELTENPTAPTPESPSLERGDASPTS